jgi:hypothetical protein
MLGVRPADALFNPGFSDGCKSRMPPSAGNPNGPSEGEWKAGGRVGRTVGLPPSASGRWWPPIPLPHANRIPRADNLTRVRGGGEGILGAAGEQPDSASVNAAPLREEIVAKSRLSRRRR